MTEGKVKFSIKYKFLLSQVVLFLISFGIFLFYSMDIFYSDKKAYIFENSLENVESASERLLNFINDKISTTNLFSSAAMVNIDKDTTFINDEIFNNLPDLLDLSIYNIKKEMALPHFYISNKDLLEQFNENKSYFEKRHKTFAQDVVRMIERGSYIKIINKKKIAPHLLIGKYYPKKEKLIVFRILLHSTVAEIYKVSSFNNFLTDKKGLIIAHNNPQNLDEYFDKSYRAIIERINTGRISSGVIEYTKPHPENPETILIAYKRIKGFDLITFSEISKSAALHAAFILILKTLVLAIFILAALNICAILLSNSLTGPIKKLVEGTLEVAKGNFGKKIEIRSRDELSLLATSFNDMNEKIVKFIAELEEKVKTENRLKEELKLHSINLEKTVKKRTEELAKSNQFIKAMINSLNEGLFVFDKKNECQDNYTKICEELFSDKISGQKVWEILNIKENEIDVFKEWSDTAFQDLIPFKDIAALGVQQVDLNEKKIALSYFPQINDKKKIEGIVVVSKDVTQELKRKEELEETEEYSLMIVNIFKNRESFFEFIKDSKKMIGELLNLLNIDLNEEAFHTTLRALHTIKGTSSIFHATPIAQSAHNYEDHLGQLHQYLDTDNFVPQFQNVLPTLQTNLSDLNIALDNLIKEYEKLSNSSIDLEDPKTDLSLRDLKDFALKIPPDLQKEYLARFIYKPAKSFFEQYEILLKSLLEKQQKKITPFLYKNGDLRIEPDNYSKLFTSLVHYFRNIADHAIELPTERIESGKPQEANIEIAFEITQQRSLNIMIQDDGKGIDPNVIREKLIEKNFDPQQYENKSDNEIIQFVFEKGFSTAKDITELSGRGVGMDAIKEAVKELNGEIQIRSTIGKGSTLSISIPS